MKFTKIKLNHALSKTKYSQARQKENLSNSCTFLCKPLKHFWGVRKIDWDLQSTTFLSGLCMVLLDTFAQMRDWFSPTINLDYGLNCSTNTVIFRFIGGVRVNPRSQGWSVLPHIDVFGESQFCVTPRIWKRLQPKRAVELLHTATDSARRGVSTCRSIEDKRINVQDEESDLTRSN